MHQHQPVVRSGQRAHLHREAAPASGQVAGAGRDLADASAGPVKGTGSHHGHRG